MTIVGATRKLSPHQPNGEWRWQHVERRHYATWHVNTFITATIRTLLAVFLSAMAGYALATIAFRSRHFFFMLLLITLTLPFHVRVISQFKLMVVFQGLNSYWANMFHTALSGLSILLMRRNIVSAPDVLSDAARVHGSSETGIFWRISAPLARPSRAVVGILAVVATWYDCLWQHIAQSQDIAGLSARAASE